MSGTDDADHGSDQSRSLPRDSVSLLNNLNKSAPAPERITTPDLRVMMPMRDGVRLDTYIWLPKGEGPWPTILWRAPYREEVIGWARMGWSRYVDEGYAFACQLIRGTGASEGEFTFNSPAERNDGYDTIEWIAAQSWCDGNVGMDGGSYGGNTQFAAAATRPPHLRCILPQAPSVDFFREIPYRGGGFSRLHTINWLHLITIKSIAELTGGFISAMPILSQPAWLRRLTMRPVIDAAEDILVGDRLSYYREALEHATFDDYWKERTFGPQDYAAFDLPALFVTGNFDPSIGTMTAWDAVMANAPDRADIQILIGPWDHGQVYAGGGERYGPFELDPTASADPFPIRLAFFDKHLKGKGAGPDLGGKAKIYITGRNAYSSFTAYPPQEVKRRPMYLDSGGRANGERGDGKLVASPSGSPLTPDRMRADPSVPFIPTMADASGRTLDLREHARHIDTLVYASKPLTEPVTVIGEAEAVLYVSVDAPDADVAAYLAEIRPDGSVVQLGNHILRLRYRSGFDREVTLVPGEPVEARIKLTFASHEFAPGHRIALLLRPDMFPMIDPNPNTGEPIATAVEERIAVITVHHDAEHASRLELPVLEPLRGDASLPLGAATH